jgi:hypothetical protein
MVHSGWSVDHGIMYQVQSTLPAGGTWYMVLGT